MEHITIIGGGIIGCATAYYLSQLGHTNVTLIEQSGIACHSSGKAGGFLARKWCDSTDLKDLARTSFELHQGLAKEYPELDYRNVDTYKVVTTAEKRECEEQKVKWLDGNVKEVELLDSKTDTAKVSPGPLCHKLIKEAQHRGVKVIIGKVDKVVTNGSKVEGVQVGEEILPVDKLLIATGPWTTEFIRTWLPHANLPAIPPQTRAHSVVLKPEVTHPMSECLFLYHHSEGEVRDPEIYPIPDGTVYVCGEVDYVPLPSSADQIKPNVESCKRIISDAGCAVRALETAEVVKMQACYLPDSYDNLPMIGKVEGYNEVYVGSGHTFWGILNGPATGKCLAELMMSGESKTCDISKFDPARFSNL